MLVQSIVVYKRRKRRKEEKEKEEKEEEKSTKFDAGKFQTVFRHV